MFHLRLRWQSRHKYPRVKGILEYDAEPQISLDTCQTVCECLGVHVNCF